jgi:hypothetical protein
MSSSDFETGAETGSLPADRFEDFLPDLAGVCCEELLRRSTHGTEKLIEKSLSCKGSEKDLDHFSTCVHCQAKFIFFILTATFYPDPAEQYLIIGQKAAWKAYDQTILTMGRSKCRGRLTHRHT